MCVCVQFTLVTLTTVGLCKMNLLVVTENILVYPKGFFFFFNTQKITFLRSKFLKKGEIRRSKIGTIVFFHTEITNELVVHPRVRTKLTEVVVFSFDYQGSIKTKIRTED